MRPNSRSDEPNRDSRRFSDPPVPSAVLKANGKVEWPTGWSLERKLFALDFRRRECTPGRPARSLDANRFLAAMVESLRAEFGDRIYDLIENSEKAYTAKYHKMQNSSTGRKTSRMGHKLDLTIDDIIKIYNNSIQTTQKQALDSPHAYRGYVRLEKGKLVENICELLVSMAWRDCGGKPEDLTINSKKVPIKINKSYLSNFSENDKNRMSEYTYDLKVDRHVEIHNEFIMGIECKAYTGNAMLKRILTDFHLLKTSYPKLVCVLFQFESQLGGEYSDLTKDKPTGGSSALVLQSHFSDVDLKIITLLEGERDVKAPIHEFPKELTHHAVERAKNIICEGLRGYANSAGPTI